MKELVMDNSNRSCFRQCKKKYFLQVVNGWQSNFGSTALRFGSCWHGIQEGYHSWVTKNGWPQDETESVQAITQGLALGQEVYEKESASKEFYDDYKNYNTAVQCFSEYLDYFQDDKRHMEIVGTEDKFSCLIEPDSKKEEKFLNLLGIPLLFTGKIDLKVKMDSIKWILDFKTTGWHLDKVVQQQNRSPQLIGYSYAGKKVMDFESQGCLVSFLYIASTKSRVTGEYGKVRNQFRRVPQIYTEGDIEAWKLSFIDTAIEIKRAYEQDFWPESFDNCHQYGACSYLPLCQQHVPYEDLNFDGFHVDHWNVLNE